MHIIKGDDILISNSLNIRIGDRIHMVHEKFGLAAVAKRVAGDEREERCVL